MHDRPDHEGVIRTLIAENRHVLGRLQTLALELEPDPVDRGVVDRLIDEITQLRAYLDGVVSYLRARPAVPEPWREAVDSYIHDVRHELSPPFGHLDLLRMGIAPDVRASLAAIRRRFDAAAAILAGFADRIETLAR